MKIFKLIIYPISLLYGMIMSIRNFLFDLGILRSKRTPISSIVVGNLKTGGTGKTPHVEFLISRLKNQFNIAVLSRGYGRGTSTFIIADESSTSKHIGDEPLQIKNKFNDIIVAVNANRNEGVNKILKAYPKTNLVILDDAYQHRYLQPNICILLTEYSDLYIDDLILPTGNLREFVSGANRADVIVVTKSPELLSPIDKRLIVDKLNVKSHQTVFFSYTCYKNIRDLNNNTSSEYDFKMLKKEKYSVLLFTGIADATNINYYIKNNVHDFKSIEFPDHYHYKNHDINKIKNIFDSIENPNKIILTTEKDAMRLKDESFKDLIVNLPIFYIPIDVKIHNDREEELINKILEHVR